VLVLVLRLGWNAEELCRAHIDIHDLCHAEHPYEYVACDKSMGRGARNGDMMHAIGQTQRSRATHSYRTRTSNTTAAAFHLGWLLLSIALSLSIFVVDMEGRIAGG